MPKFLTQKQVRALEKAVSEKYWSEWRHIPGIYGRGVDVAYIDSPDGAKISAISVNIFVQSGRLVEVIKKMPSKIRGRKIHFIEV